MFTDFTATDRWGKKASALRYQALIVAIATRHADAVDIKFSSTPAVWVALPPPPGSNTSSVQARRSRIPWPRKSPALSEDRVGSGEGLGREMYSLTVDETLQHWKAWFLRSSLPLQPLAHPKLPVDPASAPAHPKSDL